MLVSSCIPEKPTEIIFEDFESGSFKNWEIQGTAFQKPYLVDTVTNLKLKESVIGKYFAYSYINDNKLNQGKLISKEFTINHKYIDFLIGGGMHKTRTCINLIVNNKIVRTQTGFGQPSLSKMSWNVSEFINQNAIIEIVDALYSSASDLSYIMVDQIVFSDHLPKPTIVFEDFESSTFKHWKVVGNAFKIPGNRNNIYYPETVNGFEGKNFAFSFGQDHDLEKGLLISETFKISRKYITFLVGGGNHPDTTCIKLVVNNNIVHSSTGLNTGELRREGWDVTPLLGQKAHIEILDNYSGHWGHIIVDDIRFVDDLNSNEAENIDYHSSPENGNYLLILFSILASIIIALFFVKNRRTSKQLVEKKKFRKTVLNLLEEEKIFLNKSLSSEQIARQLNLTNNEFNSHFEAIFKKSFTDLVNEYRINYFKEEVLKPENKGLKLVAISEKCGFSSKSTFYRIFKKHTGITPTDYLADNKEHQIIVLLKLFPIAIQLLSTHFLCITNPTSLETCMALSGTSISFNSLS